MCSYSKGFYIRSCNMSIFLFEQVQALDLLFKVLEELYGEKNLVEKEHGGPLFEVLAQSRHGLLPLFI